MDPTAIDSCDYDASTADFGHDLEASVEGIFQECEDIRGSFGRAHGVRNRITALSKQGIDHVIAGDMDRAEDCYREMICKLQGPSRDPRRDPCLGDLTLKPNQYWQFYCSAAQELVEFVIFRAVFNFIAYGTEFSSIRRNLDFEVSSQAWLAGMCDASSEITKSINKIAIKLGVIADPVLHGQMIERFFHVANRLYKILNSFYTAYEHAISTDDGNRGYWNTFRGKIDRLGEHLADIEGKRVAALIRIQEHDERLALKEEVANLRIALRESTTVQLVSVETQHEVGC